MNRGRQNTDTELLLIELTEGANIRVYQEQLNEYDRTEDVEDHQPNSQSSLLFKLIYNKYSWNFFMTTLFIGVRLFGIQTEYATITINEWYNDTLFFILANNYIYKRLHWNNAKQSFFNTPIRGHIIKIFILSFVIFTIINANIGPFYIAKSSILSYDLPHSILFTLIVGYISVNQLFSFHFMYTHNFRTRILLKQFIKYILLCLYLLMDLILITLAIPVKTTGEHTNDYHIHHWFVGLLMIIMTEIPQPYYSILQYIHYSVYMHGVAMYGYDVILT